MAITVSGKNIEIGESLKNFAQQELQNTMQQCVGDFMDAQILIKKNQSSSNTHHCTFRCEVDVHVSRGFFIHSDAEDEDAYACLTQAMNTLKQRTRRYKARLQGKMRKQQKEAVALSRFVLEAAREEEKIQDNPLIIAEMADTMEELSVGDAVMQLDLSASPVLVFKNIGTGDVNVVYKRPDGQIGWVAPKARS